MRKKNLLIDEYPLLVLPSLAKDIGLNKAIALQQLHYWLENPKGGVMLEGERWVYNTYEDWQRDNFPFWSVRTVQRVFVDLEKDGFVISKQKAEYDRKKYYRIHYDKLASWNGTDCRNPEFQDGTKEGAKVASSLTETTTETTETEEDEALAQISKAYEGEIGSITSMIADDLKDASTTFPLKWVLDAIHEAAIQNKRNWKYIEAILRRWKAQGNQEPMKKGKFNGHTPAESSGERIDRILGVT